MILAVFWVLAGLLSLVATMPQLGESNAQDNTEMAELSPEVAQVIHQEINLPAVSLQGSPTQTLTSTSSTDATTMAVRRNLRLSPRVPTSPGNVPRFVSPFSEQERKCHNEADFRGHADIRSGKQHDGVAAFCKSAKGKATLTKSINGVPPYPAIRFRHVDRWKINHDYKVEWEPGCETSERSQDIQEPTGPDGPGCYNLMRANYLNCNNGGVGGTVKVGCLLYTYNGGKAGRYY